MNYDVLAAELALPAYVAMTDAEARDSLNLVDIVRIKLSMTNKELLAEQDAGEYIALTDAKKSQWLSLLGADSIDPQGQAVEIVKDIWGNGSTTMSNLNAARNETISRATELEIGEVSEGDVAFARTL